MTFYNNPPSNLITPPKEEEEIYPYRRIWRSVIIESGILLVLMLVIFVAWTFLGVRLSGNVQIAVNALLALGPALLWLFFSRIAERFALEPRQRLLTVFIVSGLVANAIALPLLRNVFEPDSWLPLQGIGSRIIGYTLTVGVLHEFLKYLVVRYVAWTQHYRERLDAVAYGVAGAIGYSMVLNLDFVLRSPDTLADVLIIQVFATTTLHIVGSTMVAYGLSETLFDDALSFLLPFTLVLASLLVGIAIPMRLTFSNAPLGLTDSATRGIFGMAFAMVFYIGMMLILWFFFDVSERRERDRLSSEVE